MAKIRVYELARDLNMTNKALLNKLKVLEIEVKSHMSSLEDEEIKKIKESVLGKKSESQKDKRVKPSVIRRRKKPQEAKSQEMELEPEEPPQPELEEEPEAVETPVATEPAEVAAETAEEPAPEKDEEPLETEPAPKAAKTKPAPKKKAAAKIISRPVDLEPEPEPEPEPVAQEESPQVQEPEVLTPEPAEKPAAPKAPETKEEEAETGKPEEAEAPVQEQEEQKPAKPETAVTEEGVVEETAKDEKESDKELKKKKKKKVKKSMAAKIVKLSDVDTAAIAENLRLEERDKNGRKPKPVRNGKPARFEKPAPQEAPAPRKTFEPEAPKTDAGDTDTRGKKGKKKPAKFGDSEKGFPKKKTSLKRKSIVEGSELYEDSGRGRKGRRGGKQKPKPIQKTQITTPKAIKRRLKIEETIILSDLAKLMSIKANEMIVKLMGMGVMATVNQTIDFDTAELVASEFGYEVERAATVEDILMEIKEVDSDDKLKTRAPVVTIMGHVDHGKTSLLDVIRSSKVTDSEAGGITQHIGAYNVETENGHITFLDTPGHAAFTAMRARGAKVTDIVILVVAADDGVMPQTVEAINHSKAAGVPMIVAVNKIDKEEADPDRIKRELSEHGVLAEDWGGDTIFVPVSAKQQTGIEELLEMVLLQSEVLELKANPDKLATGHVVEAKLDTGRGPVATILVQNGTLRAGQPVVCGIHHGKIRMMIDDLAKPVSEAGPAIPVEIVGLSGVPEAGDELVALEDDKNAKQISNLRMQKQRSMELAKSNRLSLEGLFERMQEGEVKDLNLIIKADVHGSIEALRESLVKLSTDEVKVKIAHAATGTVTESDISLAALSNAIVIGFNVRPAANVYDMAKDENVDMRFYSIIYNAIQDVKDAMLGMMESTFVERVLGRAEVRDTFVIPKKGTVAGCYVQDGKFERGQNVRLLREGVIIFDGKMASLRRFKDDVKEVATGYECGIGIENFNDIKNGDIIECYCMDEIKPTMD